MSYCKKFQSLINVVLVNAFLFSNFFFYLSAYAANQNGTEFRNQLVIGEVDQSLSGDLFDLNQFDQNIYKSNVNIDNELTFFKLNVGAEFNQFSSHRLFDKKPKTHYHKSKRATRKIFLTIHALKIP